MHELAIAESIVAIAERHAEGRRVTGVELKVGHLRQVVPSALTFAFELITEGTVLEGAELMVEDVPAAGECRDCGAQTPLPDFPLRCASCGGLDVELTAGEELVVDSLEITENERRPSGRLTDMRAAKPLTHTGAATPPGQNGGSNG